MSELLRAAKAVICHWNEFGAFKIRHHIPALRAAVERAEAEPKNGLDQLIERIRFLEQQIEEKKNR